MVSLIMLETFGASASFLSPCPFWFRVLAFRIYLFSFGSFSSEFSRHILLFVLFAVYWLSMARFLVSAACWYFSVQITFH